jgi:FlaA1/EpsC-like NDP-sugar epimerase
MKYEITRASHFVISISLISYGMFLERNSSRRERNQKELRRVFNMTSGKQGEMLFRQIMINKGYKVVDVSDNPEYWRKDIDFIITSPTTG